MGADNTEATHVSPPARRSGRLTWFSGYPLVLVFIGASYWVTAFQNTHNLRAIALLIQLVTIALVFHAVRIRRSVQHVSWWVLGVGIVVIVIVLISGQASQALDVVLASAAALAYLVAPIVVLSTELRRKVTDEQTLFAVVCSYLFIGMFFTYFYNTIALWSAQPVFEGGQLDDLTNLLFFSFTTLTTTGYGNLIPSSAGVQSIAIAEAIIGQLFLIIAVAHVAAGWSRTLRDPT